MCAYAAAAAVRAVAIRGPGGTFDVVVCVLTLLLLLSGRRDASVVFSQVVHLTLPVNVSMCA